MPLWNIYSVEEFCFPAENIMKEKCIFDVFLLKLYLLIIRKGGYSSLSMFPSCRKSYILFRICRIHMINLRSSDSWSNFRTHALQTECFISTYIVYVAKFRCRQCTLYRESPTNLFILITAATSKTKKKRKKRKTSVANYKQIHSMYHKICSST